MMGRKILTALLVAVFLVAIGSANIRSAPIEDAAEPPLSGEDLWRQLPVELLADVIEGKMEAISELEDDIATIRDIQAARQAGE